MPTQRLVQGSRQLARHETEEHELFTRSRCLPPRHRERIVNERGTARAAIGADGRARPLELRNLRWRSFTLEVVDRVVEAKVLVQPPSTRQPLEHAQGVGVRADDDVWLLV